jgi:hypothetical protein
MYRSLRDLLPLIDLAVSGGVQIATVRAGDFDLGSASGIAHVQNMGVWAEYESRMKAERQARKHAELAEHGRWKGGPRPFGYVPDAEQRGSLVVVADEAAVVREVAARRLGGESLYAICQDLNQRGVPTAKGARWRTATLKRILTAPTTAGLRDHHGDVVGPGCWPAILDRADWERLCLLEHDPSRSRVVPRRSYLLTGGIARCGRCGGPLSAQRRSSGARTYACYGGATPDRDGCGRLSCQADPLERVVAERVLLALEGPALGEALARDSAADAWAHDELGTVQRKQAQLADAWATDQLSKAEWDRARNGLANREKVARERLARSARTATLAPYAEPGRLRCAWAGLTLDQQRAIVVAVVDQVVVRPATSRGPRFDPDRVEVLWRV